MKAKLFAMLLLSTTIALKAQQGNIIVVDFEPDSCITDQYARLWVDFDNDDNGDIVLKMPYSSTGYWPEIVAQEGWEITWLEDNDPDTISNIDHWGQTYLWLDDESQSRFAARKLSEYNTYVFVWFEAYNHVTFNPFICHLCFDKFVYCNIPDYPLVWGQTSFTGIDENENNNHSSIATLYPNPTTDLVTVTGENLQQVEVINMLGQQVLSVQGGGNEMQINMSNLPAGIYFVAVTDEEGRKCVQKVVKE